MFTRCPTCQTTYRVHPEQLSAAAGLVRCGQCETVFQALEHLFEIKHSPYPSATAATVESMEEPVTEEVAAPPIEEQQEIIASEEHESEEHLPTEGEELNIAHEELDQAIELIEQEEYATSEPRHSAETEISTDDQLIEAAPLSFEGQPDTSNALNETMDSAKQEEWTAAEQNASISEEIKENESLATETEPSPQEEPSKSSNELDEILEVVEQLDEISLHELSTSESLRGTTPANEFIGPLRPEIEAVESEPFLGLPEQPASHPFLTLLKAIIALLLITGLAVQLIYFNRVELAKSPDLRPLLEQGCTLLNPYIPCKIPFQEELSRFEILDRDIRSHSGKAGTLTVNAIVINNAAFTQPYPIIKLSFHSLEGETIAERSFPPSLYLEKNININNGMASGEKIRLTLDIVDPGPEAVNFLFDFSHAPQ